MTWIYLSPHLDDVALSCGGLLWEQAQKDRLIDIWTICAGDLPPVPLSSFAKSLHLRWEVGRDAALVRRNEDAASCTVLGARFYHFPFPDCIYRRSPLSGEALYASEAAIFGPLHSDETGLVEDLARHLARKLHTQYELVQLKLVCPLALGGHVDHRLVRAAAELLDCPLWYYADYPYVVENADDIPGKLPDGWELEGFPISAAGMHAWVESVAAHRSQIDTFWPDIDAMEDAIREYARSYGGVRLWRPPRDAN